MVTEYARSWIRWQQNGYAVEIEGCLLVRAVVRLLLVVERQVQFENVHPRLAEKAELPSLGVSVDQLPDHVRLELARLGNAPHLVQRRSGADVRIETAAGSRDQIDRDRRGVARVGRPQRIHAPLDRLDERGIRRAEIRARRGARVVPERARRRRAAPEVLGIVERLADERRAYGLAVLD